MKNIVRGIIFWTIVMTFVSIMFAVGQALINVITINFITNLVYVLLAISIVYILKNI